MPGGVNGSHTPKIEPKWERAEPTEIPFQFHAVILELIEGLQVLVNILIGSAPYPNTRFCMPLHVKTDSVVFMVPKDRQGMLGFNHVARYLKRFPYLRPPIDKITKENCLPIVIGMTKDSVTQPVPKLTEECFQFMCIPVDVTDEIVNHNL